MLGIVALVGTLAAQLLGEREAVNDAARTTGVIAEAVVEPALTAGLAAGDPAAIAAFDDVVREQVLTQQIVRVKLWRPDGQVLYADEPALIGRTFALSDDQLTALNEPSTLAEISTLDENENEFEKGSKLVEVYRPVWFPDGSIALFEIYQSYDTVGERSSALWRGFAGVTASSLVLLVVLIAPIVWHLIRRLGAAEQQRAELLQRAVEASDIERRRIAASLHDGPVQELAASSFTAAGAAAVAGKRGDETLAKELDGVAATVRASIKSLRTLLVEIYPPSLEQAGLVAALSDLAQAQQRPQTQVHIDLDPAAASNLSPEHNRLIFRVAQECFRNAAKHAKANSLLLRLSREGGATVLDVVDDGLGFDTAAVLSDPREGHFGVRILADLTSQPGVRLDVSSGTERGTHWRLSVHPEEAGA